MTKYWFDGSLSSNKRNGSVKTACQSFYDQRSRCYNKKHPLYKSYGAKGLGVEYSCREFVGWWLHNLEKRQWEKAVAGRIDHSNGYSFENVEMQESSDNSTESSTRNKEILKLARASATRFSKKVTLSKDGKPYCSFYKLKDAADFLDCGRDTVLSLIRKKPKWTRFPYEIKFVEAQ